MPGAHDSSRDGASDGTRSSAVPPTAVLAVPGLGVALSASLVALIAMQVAAPPLLSARSAPPFDLVAFFPRIWQLFPSTADPVRFHATIVVPFCLAWLTYAGLVLTVGRWRAEEVRCGMRPLWAIIVLAHVAIVTAPPLLSADLFRYALFGRMVLEGAGNPYVTPGSALVGEPLLPFASWPNVPSNYGPTFTWISALLVWLAGGGVFATAMAFKIAMAAANLACCVLVRAISRQLGDDGRWALVVYGCNPLVIVETAGMGHNEPLMLALALGGLFLAGRGQTARAWLALVLSFDVKQVTGALLGPYASRFVFHTRQRRAMRAAMLVGVGAAVLVVLWAPFWSTSFSVETWRALLLRGDGMAPGGRPTGTSLAALLGFAVVGLAGCAAAARAPLMTVRDIAAVLMLLFLVLIYPFKYPWYVVPVIGLAAAGARSMVNTVLLLAAVFWGAILSMTYMLPAVPG